MQHITIGHQYLYLGQDTVDTKATGRVSFGTFDGLGTDGKSEDSKR